MADLLYFGESTLLDLIGRTVVHGEFVFVAALVDGPIGARGRHLEAKIEGCESDESTEERRTLWTRARIGRVFGIAPPSPLGRRCLLDAAFLAVKRGRNDSVLEVHPFVCTDFNDDSDDYDYHDMRVGLAFEPTEPSGRATMDQIAEAFWDLLLAAPDELATFGDYYESPYARHRVGCDGRGLILDDVVDASRDDPCSPPAGFGLDGRWPCPDCDGEGIELLADLVEQDCETCRGSGVVAWIEEDASGRKAID